MEGLKGPTVWALLVVFGDLQRGGGRREGVRVWRLRTLGAISGAFTRDSSKPYTDQAHKLVNTDERRKANKMVSDEQVRITLPFMPGVT